jgi:hypothetical protein
VCFVVLLVVVVLFVSAKTLNFSLWFVLVVCRELLLVYVKKCSYLRAVDGATNIEHELHPDGNSFDFLQGLIVAKK